MPHLLEVDGFYMEMWHNCGNSLSNVKIYCEAFGLTNEEFIEAIKIISLISYKVK